MSNGSPTAYLLWAILSTVFLVSLFLHLWAYDRFNCLRWDSRRQPGAFKHLMTYSYVATLPLLVIFSVAMTALKYREGYYLIPNGQIVPRPFSAWDPSSKSWLLPLYFVLSFAWAFELVTHLEELAFWLFLLHQGPGKRESWFQSWEFRTWYLGSMVAVLGMPLTTLVSRREIERVQAWIFIAGSSAGTATTLAFLYVLFRFPAFIRYVKTEGAEPDVVVRLATFYQLNRIRVVFRFLFTIPLFIIGVDAIKGPFPVIGNPFALDFLLMIGGLGCFISSAITLLVFFPRSITRESGYKAKIISPHPSAGSPSVTSPLPNYYNSKYDAVTPKSAHSEINHDPAHPTSARMDVFRFPPSSHPVYATQSEPPYPRRSLDSESSPEYESDVDSAIMTPTTPATHLSPPPSINTHSQSIPPHHDRSHPTPHQRPRHDSSTIAATMTTVTSRPTSGGRSDDTAWERTEDAAARWRQRFSDGQHRRLSVPVVAGSRPTSEEGHRSSIREASTTSHLHPYLVNFTSPIDLAESDSQLPVDTSSRRSQIV